MKNKKVLSTILALVMPVCSIIAASGCTAIGTGDPSGDTIYSDGNAYPIASLEDLEPVSAISAKTLLPTVGSHETLLKLLHERGVLYDPDAVRDGNPRGGGILDFFTNAMVQDDAMPMMEAATGSSSSVADAAAPADGGESHSETNEQVEGVSEGDIVKTDGEYIYSMLHSGKLHIIKADGAELEVVSTITLEDISVSEFYLVGGDRLVVVGSEYKYIEPVPYDTAERNSEPLEDAYYYNPYSRGFTVAAIFDISDKSAPSETRRVSMDGWSVATRIADNTLYMVTNKYIWAVPQNQADSELILPYVCDTAEGEEYLPLSYNCIYIVPDTESASYLMIGALDIYGDDAFEPEAYFGAGSDLYMSRNAMYLTNQRWVDLNIIPGRGSGMMTDILRFAVSGTDVTYTGMGTVAGTPINQYSMDEYEGFFRIATTDWGVGTYVTVLDVEDMKFVGRTEPLAPNEQMRSARFMGDTGYVVTFENTDPLFTIDLSDPYNPKVLGELKIPGFSQYLHPVGDGLLLGIGRDTQEIFTRDANGKETAIGFRDVGLKVSLFDVSDLHNPIEVSVLPLGEGWAEVSYNPRALMADKGRGIYGFIMESWGASAVNEWKYGHTAVLLQVEDAELSVAAAIDMPNDGWYYSNGRLCYIGDTLYVVHYEGIDVYDYATFDKLGGITY